MSHMKNLSIEIENAGIDHRIVDPETVGAYRDAYHYKSGHTMPMIGAIREIYGKGEIWKHQATEKRF